MTLIHDLKVVTARHGSIAAAGDISITINVHGGAQYDEIVRDILHNLNVNDPQLLSSLSKDHDDRSAEEKIGNILLVANSSALSTVFDYGHYFSGLERLKALVSLAVLRFRDHDYIAAHTLFREALELGPDAPVKLHLVYDYFVSGYVGYSLLSDVVSVRSLLSELRDKYYDLFDRSISISMAEAHQEVATRQVSDEMLQENKQMVDELLQRHGWLDVQCLNLEGLLYRRFGERQSSGDQRVVYLEKAISTFEEIQRVAGDEMGIEAKNNWAIALIRHFELTNLESSLNEAEELLRSIDHELSTPLPLSDFLALPKALNNLGNVSKQRLALTRDAQFYTDAVENYGRTERFWDEAGSPYEWAMIQKNKADVRCLYLELFGHNQTTAERALKEIELSLRYRTKAHAPYQYERSMRVKERLEIVMKIPN